MKIAIRLILPLLVILIAAPASAQPFDPRAPLLQLIQAFQYCGPSQSYQLLDAQLYQAVARQTGGRGCYADIAAAGPVLGAQIVDQREFPLGSLYVIRVIHQSGAVADWFIGFNRITTKVEYLTYQNTPQGTASKAPTVSSGPAPSSKGPSDPPSPSPAGPAQGSASTDGCDLYPAMCQ